MRVPSNLVTSPLTSTLPRYWAGAMTVTPRTCTSFHSSWAFWVTTSQNVLAAVTASGNWYGSEPTSEIGNMPGLNSGSIRAMSDVPESRASHCCSSLTSEFSA